MAFLAAAIPYITTAMSVAGSRQSANAARAAGKAAQQEKEFEAQQYDQQSMQSVAAGQRSASEQEQRARLMVSRAIALSAAGGGSVSDPSVVNTIADIEGEGAYRAATELYKGEEQSRQLRMGASASRYEGEILKRGGEAKGKAYDLQAVSALAKQGSSMYEKYGAKQKRYQSDLQGAAAAYGWN